MLRQHCTNFPEIAQEKSRANIEQKDKIIRNTDIDLIYFSSFIFWKNLRRQPFKKVVTV